MRNFNKAPDKLYFGLPSGSLQSRILEILEKVGWPVASGDREYEFPSYKDRSLVFRILKNREMPEAVAKGVVDCSIVGEDMLIEKGQVDKVEPIGKLPFSRKTNNPVKLVLAAQNGTYRSPDELKGVRIATEFPRLTRLKLKELLGFEEDDMWGIFPSEGKTEAKVGYGMADAITDLSETGTTLRVNGFEEIATLFESYPQMVANPAAVEAETFRGRIEDMFFLMESTLNAERQPSFLIRANISTFKWKELLPFLPNPNEVNILPTDSDVISILFMVEADRKRDVVTTLKRNGAERIIAEAVTEVYGK
jgi:ATP phosphoribosyltransferase